MSLRRDGNIHFLLHGVDTVADLDNWIIHHNKDTWRGSQTLFKGIISCESTPSGQTHVQMQLSQRSVFVCWAVVVELLMFLGKIHILELFGHCDSYL